MRSPGGHADDGEGLPKEAVYEAMDPLEPYTTDELTDRLDKPRDLVRRALDQLFGDGEIRKKDPEPSRPIWIREPTKHTCPDCGRTFEVKYLHAVLSAVRFCPRCGTTIET